MCALTAISITAAVHPAHAGRRPRISSPCRPASRASSGEQRVLQSAKKPGSTPHYNHYYCISNSSTRWISHRIIHIIIREFVRALRCFNLTLVRSASHARSREHEHRHGRDYVVDRRGHNIADQESAINGTRYLPSTYNRTTSSVVSALNELTFTCTLRVMRSSTITRQIKREWLTHTPRFDPKKLILVRLRCLRGPSSSSSPMPTSMSRNADLRLRRSRSSLSEPSSSTVMLLVLALLGMLVWSEPSMESRGSSSAVLSVSSSMERDTKRQQSGVPGPGSRRRLLGDRNSEFIRRTYPLHQQGDARQLVHARIHTQPTQASVAYLHTRNHGESTSETSVFLFSSERFCKGVSISLG